MVMQIRKEVLPFLAASWMTGILIAVGLYGGIGPGNFAVPIGAGFAIVLTAYLLYFFRDPERVPPADSDAIVAGADGVIAAIAEMPENQCLKTDCVRISIFLSLFDVHVNRAPISGISTFLGYFPGKRLFTFQEKSSDLNQHNKILIAGNHVTCLVNQIVGPVCRRVVYWLPHDKPTDVAMGERIGMMKFGSRLDLYLPADRVEAIAKIGDRVRAGETVIARVKGATT
jgi:phosphatidylserine decarboxylase